jgi:hypothetical protein
MLTSENITNQYLVGGVDEISAYNYNINWLNGWYKTAPTADFYDETITGSLAGEGSAMYSGKWLITRCKKHNWTPFIFFHTTDAKEIANQLGAFVGRII